MNKGTNVIRTDTFKKSMLANLIMTTCLMISPSGLAVDVTPNNESANSGSKSSDSVVDNKRIGQAQQIK